MRLRTPHRFQIWPLRRALWFGGTHSAPTAKMRVGKRYQRVELWICFPARPRFNTAGPPSPAADPTTVSKVGTFITAMVMSARSAVSLG